MSLIRHLQACVAEREKAGKRLRLETSRLADLLGRFSPFGRRRRLQATLRDWEEALTAFVTAQDREWDAGANNHSHGVFESLQWKIRALDAEYGKVRSLLTAFAGLEDRLTKLADRLDRGMVGPGDGAVVREMALSLSPHRYADFEARFRGSKSEIQEQLRPYLTHLEGKGPVMDLGCGRGEFLGLLAEAGMEAFGVDSDPSMLEEARLEGLTVHQADGLAYLEALPEASLGAIFSAQVIEHLPPEALRPLVQAAGRALRPGGVLILETVNPLSVFALSRIFFLDISHQRPLHPEYMRYMLESCGLGGVEVLYGAIPRQEQLEYWPEGDAASRVPNANIDKLNHLLYGPQVYAVKGTRIT